jgi:mono/diheme cytochrome c family protein
MKASMKTGIETRIKHNLKKMTGVLTYRYGVRIDWWVSCLLAHRIAIAVLAMCSSFAIVSCDRDKNNPGYDYFPDMAYSKAYETYAPNPNFADGKTLLAPVEGTISREAENYPYQKTDADLLKASKLRNPLLPDTATLARGKVIFQRVCLQCHGVNGDGKGFMYVSGKYPYPPANLVSEKIAKKTDGEMFHAITVGFGVMPSHGIIVRPDDRWKVILYVRSMQKKTVGSLTSLP